MLNDFVSRFYLGEERLLGLENLETPENREKERKRRYCSWRLRNFEEQEEGRKRQGSEIERKEEEKWIKHKSTTGYVRGSSIPSTLFLNLSF